ncbi:MAG: M24 family metallopeptidase [Anaerolineae bacterium]
MKADLDRLMAERNIDAAVVMGAMAGNPTLYYLVNGAKLSSGTVVKKRNEPAVLIHSSIERDEAARSGLETIDIRQYNYLELLREAGGNRLLAMVRLLARVFQERGISGRVAFYGTEDRGAAYALLRAIDEHVPGVEVVGEFGSNLFVAARSTKDPTEVERIREAGRKTVATVDATIDFLRSHRVRDNVLVDNAGAALTVGRVKHFVRRTLFDHDLEEEVETIFAIGRDAGIPHSHGDDHDAVRLGQSIVFDLFPRERGGGYFFDMTRTFCLGYAPAEVASVFEDVRACFETVVSALEAGTPAGHYHELACDFFESRCHPTLHSDPGTEEGFVHTLGHGIGLSIHEQPFIHDAPGTQDVLDTGAIFTIEPGLYYPDRGFGVRLEDVFYVDSDGVFHNLTNYPKELVIDMPAGA